ncbi:putative quinol monooxygenase [Pseudoruegeria sp. SK021]|uniref:putative quinol monooxygenase n=1 Tax=Pseudoruegeria sp. SK021 TaxID=1933035 RepID=UPI000A236820|nr:putative quinol monooxygenase [Pseudoruegeria sp. SK021]OSP54206.1 hypothetical protein BV911_13700 [Pseudoruegeria sp. SK021]
MYAVIVTFKVAPDAMAMFLPLLKKNADGSRLHEPGCRRYDVCTDSAVPDEVWVYELFDNREAYDEHLATWHLQTFVAQTAHLVDTRTIRTFDRTSH